MKKILPGLFLCAGIGAAAWVAALYIPLGGVTISIILGILAGNIFRIPSSFSPGVRFSEKRVLTWAIALTGIGLDYRILARLGWPSLLLILAGVAFTIFLARFLGRRLGMDRDLSLLVGIGNGVCGSSAIAAAQGVLKTDDKNVGLSVAVINFLGTLGIFILPALAVFVLRLPDLRAGALTGNTLQAIGQVTAAGYSISDAAGETAVIVKMGRILMITPVVLILSLRKGTGERKRAVPVIPGYILVFILLSVIGSLQIIPEEIIHGVKTASKLLLIGAMAGIGLGISVKDLASGGRQALLLGTAVWAGQILFSLLFILAVL